jgi:uracil-DNA glycosylase
MLEKIHNSWYPIVHSQTELPYFKTIISSIQLQLKSGETIYPSQSDIFNAFEHCTLENLKIVLLGQDPYHGINQAHGLAFSVQKNCKIPPSLKNIYKELQSDIGIKAPIHGCLTQWSTQGVLLLNTCLTVQEGKPNSHANIGWQTFTNEIIKQISTQKSDIVFMLWGKPAQQKIALIQAAKHHLLLAPHPSPFSAYTGFFGCQHFSNANNFLIKKNKNPIDWQIN